MKLNILKNKQGLELDERLLTIFFLPLQTKTHRLKVNFKTNKGLIQEWSLSLSYSEGWVRKCLKFRYLYDKSLNSIISGNAFSEIIVLRDNIQNQNWLNYFFQTSPKGWVAEILSISHIQSKDNIDLFRIVPVPNLYYFSTVPNFGIESTVFQGLEHQMWKVEPSS